ncbi:tetratricopeptide repeat protein [Labilibacter marinus]|uniref:tetratricopeptide repeat protein n=1 Tax=Labilibacter marinus TaxID=1477105 RepID=UPI0009500DA0|nr:tetratricopeptide repeat protein [Labilibacter marinus]
MKNIWIVLLFLLSVVELNAQLKEYKKEIVKADEFLKFENYKNASEIYDVLLKEYPEDAFVQFKAGECFLFSEARIKQSIEVLNKAIPQYPIVDKNSIEAIEARFYLGQAYHLNFQFEEALSTFQDLISQIPEKRMEAVERIEREIRYVNNAILLKKNPVEFKISNLGPVINTEFDEHSPIVNVVEDLLLFTSNRETEVSYKKPGGLYNENVYYSLWRDKKWITTRALGINTAGNNATIGISPDGGTLLIYQNDGIVGNIYTSKLKNDKWGELEKLPSPINTMANETHASFSMDGNTLFFTSDRIGGFGGKDIYKVSKLPSGEWGKVINLGDEVNTIFDEESPYVHPKGGILYFSSEGHNSMGGFDIFKAACDEEGTWGGVENIGYPINTPFDDLFFAPTIDEQRVYYASKRDDGFGGSDIYLIEFTGDHPNALTVVGGFVFMPDGEPAENAKLVVYDAKTKEKVGVYRPSPNNGKYIFIIPSGREYNMELEMDGYKSVLKDFKIPSRRSFARKKYTFYLDPIVLKKDN